MDIIEETRKWVRANKKEICRRVADLNDYPPVDKPDSFFYGWFSWSRQNRMVKIIY